MAHPDIIYIGKAETKMCVNRRKIFMNRIDLATYVTSRLLNR